MNLIKIAALLFIIGMGALVLSSRTFADDILEKKVSMPKSADSYTEYAVFAGGCFWCVESDFEKLEGVGDVISGYTGGSLDNPTYRNHDDHIEGAKIPYDPKVISYRELVDYFFRHIDPLDAGGQFCDRGHSYISSIFYQNEEQRVVAEASKAIAETILGEPVVTPIVAFDKFWDAEEYHQDYYKKSPLRYKFYRRSCGRDRRVKKLWG